METGYFTGFNKAELFYREWNFAPGQKTIIIMHRGHEHSGRLEEFATDERFAHYNIFSYDMRGHGHSPEKVSPVFMDSVRDLDAFASFLNTRYDVAIQDVFVVANSIAGVIVSAWVHDFAPDIAGMVLLAPAFEIKLYIPFAKEATALGTYLIKNLTVPSYVKSRVLTHDVAEQKAYDADPLITKDINGRLLVDLLDGGKRIVEDAGAIHVPTLVIAAGKDYVVQKKAQKQFYVRLESRHKEFIELKGVFHGLLFEKERGVVYDHIQRFAEQSFAWQRAELTLEPDRFSRDEYDVLSLQLLPWIERANFAFQKWSLSKLGFLSQGMKVGIKYGFDSGISLDYVYKNKPQGLLGIGKLMDYFYLNAIGWRGIRKRKVNLLALLEEEIVKLQEQNQPVRILDIAGGTGNYLFDLKRKFPGIEVVINDFKLSNVEFGEAVVAENGFKNIRFTNMDCFDPDTYRKLDFTPNITIISGVFELFDDNEQISRAVSGVASVSEKGGKVIYTGQPWHPQLKMIAYVLNSHRDQDWVMRRRSQKELDRVFALNGVQKEKMLIDEYDIFTVSTGQVVEV
ncbi:MAG: bifunctional alpha/beta hydrolase/class I SAM-dependent methyltransferase [Tannerellaceae bacterium]|nr:bifunctional alpha/beta hydrolase/class I SAM-dependent methyltransferase [Tannerellaceae bacterium]